MAESRLKFQFIASSKYPTAVRVGHWPLRGGPEVGWDHLAQELILKALSGAIVVTVVIETMPERNWYSEFLQTSGIPTETSGIPTEERSVSRQAPKRNWYSDFFRAFSISSEERSANRHIEYVSAFIENQGLLRKVIREIVGSDEAWDTDDVWFFRHLHSETAKVDLASLPLGQGPQDFGDVLFPIADGYGVDWHTTKSKEEVLEILEASAAVAQVDLREGVFG
ncbi:MAG: hypothetical protein ACOY9Y_02360 [Bacillota bacterium]